MESKLKPGQWVTFEVWGAKHVGIVVNDNLYPPMSIRAITSQGMEAIFPLKHIERLNYKILKL